MLVARRSLGTMNEPNIEISSTVAAIALILPAFVALAVIVLGVCIGLGLPVFVPAAIVMASVAGVSRVMRKQRVRRIGR